MDFADASLVALAEQRGLQQIFTLDSGFRVYRLRGRSVFDIVPSPGQP
jgi:predicted nucleic acid-binding protein